MTQLGSIGPQSTQGELDQIYFPGCKNERGFWMGHRFQVGNSCILWGGTSKHRIGMDDIFESDQFKGGYGRIRLGWQCSIHFMPIVLNKFVVSLFHVRTSCAILLFQGR